MINPADLKNALSVGMHEGDARSVVRKLREASNRSDDYWGQGSKEAKAVRSLLRTFEDAIDTMPLEDAADVEA